MKTGARRQSTSLEGRRALVVGGTGGIGRAASLELGRGGASSLSTAALSREKLDSTLRGSVAATRAPSQVREARSRRGLAEGFLLDLGVPPRAWRGSPRPCPALAISISSSWPSAPSLRKSLARHGPARLGTHRPARSRPARDPLLGLPSRPWPRAAGAGSSSSAARGPTGSRPYASNAAYAAAKTGLAVLVKSSRPKERRGASPASWSARASSTPNTSAKPRRRPPR